LTTSSDPWISVVAVWKLQLPLDFRPSRFSKSQLEIIRRRVHAGAPSPMVDGGDCSRGKSSTWRISEGEIL